MIQLIHQDEVVSTSQWKDIIKSYKFEMKPTKNQEVKSNHTLGLCRKLYNLGLEQKKKAYENGGWSVSCHEQINQLPELKKKDKEFQDIYADILQDVLRRLDKTYQNFFRRIKNDESGNGEYKKPGHPRFKGYGRYDSFTFPQYGNGCDIRGKNNDIIRLSKIGEIKFIKHREIGEEKNGDRIPYLIKTATIKKEIDKWFVIFTVETFVDIEVPVGIYKKEKEIKTIEELNEKCIGIDMGLSNLITLSNGKKIEPPEYLRESEKKLSKHQRRLSRKQRYEKEIVDERESKKESKKQGKKVEIKKKVKVNSKNREKERIKVAKIHRKIVNQRRNFSHEVSRLLVNNFDLISFEKLNIQGMVKNHRLAKSISDASWYQLQMFASYKAEWAGKISEFVDPKYTSQNCSRCGKLVGRMDGDIFECPFCGLTTNVHVNAGINIRDRSIEYQRLKKDIENRNIITPVTGGGACGESDRNSEKQETLSEKDGISIENMSIQVRPLERGS